MFTLKSVNSFRRRFMRQLTKNIGSDYLIQSEENLRATNIERVLICRPNHRLGNLLLIMPLIDEVSFLLPKCKIDLFIKGNLGPIIFKNYDNVDNIMHLPRKPLKELLKYFWVWISVKSKHYDLVINVVDKSSSGRLVTKISDSKYKTYCDDNENLKANVENFEHLAKRPIYCLRNYLKKLGFAEKKRSIPSINLKLDAFELAHGLKIINKLVKNDLKIICIFTYATDDKCYSKTWWLNFYDKLKVTFPSYNIIEILPVENLSMINFKAPSFYSKDIREIAAVIANTAVFIGADSGIMHLASAAQVPVVGLFSRANQAEYQPYNNNSIAVDTNQIDALGCIEIVETILKSKHVEMAL